MIANRNLPDPSRNAKVDLAQSQHALATSIARDQIFLELLRHASRIIDLDAYERLRQEKARLPMEHVKYLDFSFWLENRINLALDAGVHRLNDKDLLDIGCGVGHWPFVCQAFGNRVIATDAVDLEDSDFYTEFRPLLGLDFRPLRISAFEPLPDFGRRFDLVSALSICFNTWRDDNGEMHLWGDAEWDFLLRDLIDNQLRPGGRFLIQLNRQETWTKDAYTDEGAARYFARRGAVGQWPYFVLTREDVINTFDR